VHQLLHRLYERDVRSGSSRRTMVVALAILAASMCLLLALSRLPFREVLSTEGVIEPGHPELLRGEADGTIGRNLLRLGEVYEAGAPVLSVVSAGGAERVYAAPCRCIILRSELLQRFTGSVRAGELIAEFVDATRLVVRFPVTGRWRSAIAAGDKVHVVDAQGTSREGIIEQIYPRRGDQLGLEAIASLPGGAALSVGSAVTVRFEAPPVALWRFFVNGLGQS
jgi:hypothetical protein